MLSTSKDKQYGPKGRRRIITFSWAIEVDGLDHAFDEICDVWVLYKATIKKYSHQLARCSTSTCRCDVPCY